MRVTVFVFAVELQKVPTKCKWAHATKWGEF